MTKKLAKQPILVNNQETMSDDFAGLRVLALESRRATELAKLISSYNGQPIVAPSMREVPLESNHEALAFATKLLKGEFDLVIFLTGVGARALLTVVETKYPREDYIAALQQVKIVARGPKPVAALREIGITPTLTVPEPNRWHEILAVLDNAQSADSALNLNGKRIAVQEYGVSNPEFLAELQKRGAAVARVPVYQWALPDDLAPLRSAIHTLIDGNIDVVFFTTGVQAVHLFQVAAEMNLEEKVRSALRQTVVVSIGPTTSEELVRRSIPADFEPSHPKMGFLVKEAAERSAEILHRKRSVRAPA
jgi:uroporphyrinogen-III synthase